MAQSAITETGPIADAVVYTVPGSGPIKPLSCYAEFDASGALGAFIPVLLIRSQSGAPLAYLRADRAVAPGEYVETTWAPFLDSSSGGLSTLANLPYAYTESSFNLVANGNINFVCPLQDLITDDATLFSILTFGGNQGLQIAQVGHYLAFTTMIIGSLSGTASAHAGVKSALVNKGNFLFGTADFTIYGKCSFIEMWEVTPADTTSYMPFTVTNQSGGTVSGVGLRVVVQLDTIDPSGDPF